jgi:hypothetical protein
MLPFKAASGSVVGFLSATNAQPFGIGFLALACMVISLLAATLAD